MKKITLWMTAALVLMAVGCRKQMDIVEPTVIGSDDPVIVSGEDMVFKAANIATKSRFQDGSDEVLVWEDSDRLRIYAASGGNVFQSDVTGAPQNISDDGTTADFTPSAEGKKKTDQWVSTSGGGNVDFYAYYPVGNEVGTVGTGNTVKLNVPSTQSHSSADFGSYHICYAARELSRTEVLNGVAPTFEFIPVTSLLRVNLSLNEGVTLPEGVDLTDLMIRVKGSETIAGVVTLDVTTGEFTAIENGSNEIHVTYPSGSAAGLSAGEATVDAVILPFSSSVEVEIWARGDDANRDDNVVYVLRSTGGSKIIEPNPTYKGGFQYTVDYAISEVVEYDITSELAFKSQIERDTVRFTINGQIDTMVVFPEEWYIQAYSADGTEWIPVSEGAGGYQIPDADGKAFVTIAADETDAKNATVTLSPNTSEVKLMANGHPATELKSAEAVTGYNLANEGANDYTIQNTANCYVINAPGSYRFPLVYGNGYKDGAVNTEALRVGGYTVPTFTVNSTAPVIAWQDPDSNDLLTDMSIVTNGSVQWVEFTVEANNIREANVLLVVPTADGSSAAAWSWHIWITPFKLTDVTTTGAFIPYNLGWVSTKIASSYPGRRMYVKVAQQDGWGTATKVIEQVEAPVEGTGVPSEVGFSPYYQFGRKDPMPGSSGNVSAATGELPVKRTYYPNSNFAWGTGVAGWTMSGGQSVVVAAALRAGISNPCIFYTDWNQRPNSRTDLWSVGGNSASRTTTKTVFDPSPIGYCVPPVGSFLAGTSEASTVVIGKDVDGTDISRTSGVKLTRDGTTYFFPMLGFRTNLTGEISFVNYAYSTLSTVATVSNRSKIAYMQNDIHREADYTFGIAAPVNPIRE